MEAEAQRRAGRLVVVLREAVAEAEPWVAAVEAQPQDVLKAAVALRAVAAGRVVAPPGVAEPPRVRLPADGCRNIRRICSLGETTSRTSGTGPGELRPRPARVAAAIRAGAELVAVPRRIAAARNARRRAPSPDSYFRRMDSACTVLFLVHSRHRS